MDRGGIKMVKREGRKRVKSDGEKRGRVKREGG